MSPDTVQAFVEECADLDALVAPLDESGWRTDTPARGWTIAHQIAHLSWTDEVALASATDQAAFAAIGEQAMKDPLGIVDTEAERLAQQHPDDLLASWRTRREALGAALRSAEPKTKLPWFGPPMNPRSMATARLMETWAHGQDVADALGVRREPTDRLRDIAHLGVRTRDFAYALNELEAPGEEFRIELTGPSGDLWSWGPEDATQRVQGPAEDFCLVVAQRREAEDTGLVAEGTEAARWLTFAQVFAGAPKAMMRGRGV